MKIMCLIDGSEASLQGVQFLKRLPLRGQVHVDLVHVFTPVETNWVMVPEHDYQKIAAYNKEAKIKSQALLDEVSKTVRETFPCQTKRLEGSPKEAILEALSGGSYGLVVMGSRGLNPLKRFILGSVSEAVLTHAECAVLICKGVIPTAATGVNVICAYDGQEPAKKAMERLESFDPTRLSGVTLATTSEIMYHYGMGDSVDVTGLLESYSKVAEAMIYEASTELSKKIDKNVNSLYLNGVIDGADSICSYAQDHSLDMIVTGSSHKSALEQFAVGSFSLRTVRHAHCPVWVEK